MTTDHSIPTFPDLSPGRLSDRKRHLLAEIRRESTLRFSLRPYGPPRLRTALLVAAGVCAAVGAAALTVTLTGGSRTSNSPFVVQAVRGPGWSAYTGGPNWGGGLILACATPVQVLFGCTGLLTVPSVSEPRPAAAPFESTGATTEIDGGSLAQQKLLHSIIDAMQPSAITSIEVLSSAGGVTLRMEGADRSMESLWQESLVAAAFRDRASDAGIDARISLENGESSGVIPPGPATTRPAAVVGAAETARLRFEDAASRTGLPLDELTIYRPDGVAVAATLKTSDPAAFLVHQMPTFLAAIGGGWSDYDGVYVRLVNDAGATVWETSTVTRTSTGSVGSRQDLAGCSPVADWGPTSPACPSK